MGYQSCTQEMLDFLKDVWHRQGRTRNNCTGMSSFSFWPERMTFVAPDDMVVPAGEVPNWMKEWVGRF